MKIFVKYLYENENIVEAVETRLGISLDRYPGEPLEVFKARVNRVFLQAWMKEREKNHREADMIEYMICER